MDHHELPKNNNNKENKLFSIKYFIMKSVFGQLFCIKSLQCDHDLCQRTTCCIRTRCDLLGNVLISSAVCILHSSVRCTAFKRALLKCEKAWGNYQTENSSQSAVV